MGVRGCRVWGLGFGVCGVELRNLERGESRVSRQNTLQEATEWDRSTIWAKLGKRAHLRVAGGLGGPSLFSGAQDGAAGWGNPRNTQRAGCREQPKWLRITRP